MFQEGILNERSLYWLVMLKMFIYSCKIYIVKSSVQQNQLDPTLYFIVSLNNEYPPLTVCVLSPRSFVPKITLG